MKTITGLDTEIIAYDGEAIPDGPQEEGKKIKHLTVRNVLLAHLARAENVKLQDSIRMIKIGEAIYDAGETVELEDADYDTVKKSLDRSVELFPPIVVGRVGTHLEKCEEEQKKNEK